MNDYMKGIVEPHTDMKERLLLIVSVRLLWRDWRGRLLVNSLYEVSEM